MSTPVATFIVPVPVTTIAIPPKLPRYSKPLAKDLIGLSIESDRWTSWSGDYVGSPNVYLNQVLSNISDLTGAAVPIRVGGNSEDRSTLEEGVDTANPTFPPAQAAIPYPEATHTGIGKNYYALSANFPAGTPFTWGLNLRILNEEETVAQFALLHDTFYGSMKDKLAHVKLHTVEIGNEADVYDFKLFRKSLPNWSLYTYTDYLTSILTKISESFPLDHSNAPRFQIAAYADYTQSYIWDVVGTLSSGILDTSIGKYITSYSHHSYMGIHTPDLSRNMKPGMLMDRTKTRAYVLRMAKYAAQANDAGLEFVEGECNSIANHGEPGISDSAEAAIWLLDFSLQCASVGVSRLFFHHGIGFEYNLIQPIPVPSNDPSLSPHQRIQGAYYGAIMASDFIGPASNTRIAEIASNHTSIAAYGVWEGENLARVILINSTLHLSGSGEPRASEIVHLKGFVNGSKATVKRFFSEASTSTTGLLWGGISYETSDGVPQGEQIMEDLESASIELKATEVAMIIFA